MKNQIATLAAMLMIALLFPGAALAAPPMETKLIVDSYRIDRDAVMAGEGFTLTFSIKNTHEMQYAQNITVSVSSPDGAFLPQKTNMLYVSRLNQGKAADCAFEWKTAQTAQPGAHTIDVQVKYEDGKGMPLELKTGLPVEVAPPAVPEEAVRLRADAPEALPVGAGEPVSVKVETHNMGKGMIYNVAATASGSKLKLVKDAYGGNLQSGGSMALEVVLAFVATVAEDVKASGAWKSVKPGDPPPALEYPAKLVLTYEDASGKSYTETLDFAAKANVPKPDEPAFAVSGTQKEATPPPPAPDTTGWIVAGIAVVAAACAVMLALLKARRRENAR